jgi:L-asparaginase
MNDGQVANKPKVLIAYTGGTIGMARTPGGYQPAPGYLQQLMAELPEFQAEDVPDYHVHQFDPLLDSSDMTPADWVRIARVLRDRYDHYDGFLVLHGTDTMAFTASALSFMLEDLGKPILLTGSQIPLIETRNDARDNLLTSLMILGRHHARLAGVFLYFASQLLRGNRTTKTHSDGFEAFSSPSFPEVAQVGIDIDIDWDLVLPSAGRLPSVVEMGEATVAAFRLFPGLKAEYLTHILAPPVQGVVLECFGAGNAPANNKKLMAAITDATRRGVVIVAVTQPLQGSADLRLYANGRALIEAGVVSGHDMTAEAALAKLFYLFAKGFPAAEVRRLIEVNLRGELTPPAEVPGVLGKLRRQPSFR